MPEQAQVEPPLTLRFDVPLKDFVKHRYLNAKLSANPTCSIGELVVSLERNETSTSTEVPLVQNNSESTSAQMSSADFMDVGVSIPLVDEIDEEVGILVPRVHIAAKDHMQFLIHHFSKRRKLKKRYVKGELLGFKRAVLRDYGNRIMKFTLAIDNFRQIAPPEILHQLLMSNGASNRVNVNNGVQQAASVPQAATASGVIRPEAMTASRSGNNMTGTGGKRRLNGTGSMDASRPPSFVPKDASKSETKPEPSSSIPSSQTGHPGLVESQNKQINTAQQLLAPRNISSTATPESTLRACPPVMNGPGLTAPSVHEIVSNVNSSSAVPIGIPNPVSTLQSENNMAAQSLAPSNDFLDQYLTIGGPLQSLAQMSADIVPTNNPPSNNIQQNPGLPIQPCLRNEHRPMTTLSPQPEPDSSTSTTTLAHQQQSDHGNQTVSANGTVGAATVSIDEQSHNSPLLTSLLSTTADCSQMSADQPGQVQNEESSSNLIQIVSVSTLAEG